VRGDRPEHFDAHLSMVLVLQFSGSGLGFR
jgi:hypothetical protein